MNSTGWTEWNKLLKESVFFIFSNLTLIPMKEHVFKGVSWYQGFKRWAKKPYQKKPYETSLLSKNIRLKTRKNNIKHSRYTFYFASARGEEQRFLGTREYTKQWMSERKPETGIKMSYNLEERCFLIQGIKIQECIPWTISRTFFSFD